jgi:hypothetical protein
VAAQSFARPVDRAARRRPDPAVIWAAAFAPVLILIADLVARGVAGNRATGLWSGLIIALLVNSALCRWDRRNVVVAGYDIPPSWLVPVYLWKRARVVWDTYGYFIVWMVVFALAFTL